MDVEVSIVVPVYNVERYLKRCMDSLLAQSFPDWEIILVDDGSTDGSGALCDGYAHLPGVRVIHQQNAGLGLARNSGLAAAEGRYVMFVDSDDYVGPDLLQNLYAAAREQDADMAIGSYTMVDAQGCERAVPWVEEARVFSEADMQELVWNTVGSLPDEPLDSKYGLSAWARLYRRSLLEAHAIRFVSERELISEDLIFNLDALKHVKRAVVVPETAYFYCLHGGTLSKRHRADRFQRDCELYEAVRARLHAAYSEGDCALYLHRLLISRARFDIAQEVAYHDQSDRSYPLRQAVEQIAGHPALQSALRDYPCGRLPRMQGIFARMLQKRRVAALIVLARLRQRLLPPGGRRKGGRK